MKIIYSSRSKQTMPTNVVSKTKCPSNVFCWYFIVLILEILQPTNKYRDYFVEENMTDILSAKEITHLATLGIPKGLKSAIFAAVVLSVLIIIRSDYMYLTINYKSYFYKKIH